MAARLIDELRPTPAVRDHDAASFFLADSAERRRAHSVTPSSIAEADTDTTVRAPKAHATLSHAAESRRGRGQARGGRRAGAAIAIRFDTDSLRARTSRGDRQPGALVRIYGRHEPRSAQSRSGLIGFEGRVDFRTRISSAAVTKRFRGVSVDSSPSTSAARSTRRGISTTTSSIDGGDDTRPAVDRAGTICSSSAPAARDGSHFRWARRARDTCLRVRR
jgi:hypothetical protein